MACTTPTPAGSRLPGTSLHRYATELDLGPKAAYGWLAAHAPAFHFIQRYSWEPWHWGYTLNPQLAASAAPADGADGAEPRRRAGVRAGAVRAGDRARRAALERVGGAAGRAALCRVATSTRSRSRGAGAQGIAQFMPGTAAALGLTTRSTPRAAIDAQAHLMRDLLRRSARSRSRWPPTTPARAAVSALRLRPAIPETRGYVARILGLMGGAGQPLVGGTAGAHGAACPMTSPDAQWLVLSAPSPGRCASS